MPESLAEALRVQEQERLQAIDWESSQSPADTVQLVTGLEAPSIARAYMPHGRLHSLLSAPLFYDQPLVDVCPDCRLAEDTEPLRLVAEEGLALPVLHAPYGYYPDEFLSEISTIDHIGAATVWSLMGTIAHTSGDTCYCMNCVREELAPLDRLPPELRTSMEGAVTTRLSQLPGEILDLRLKALNERIRARDIDSIIQEIKKIEGAAQLSNSQSLAGVPQFSFREPAGASGPDPKLLSKSLSIAVAPDADMASYVGVIKSYQGKLGFLLNTSGPSWSSALDLANDINEEVREISGSKRAAALEMVSNVFRKDSRQAVEALVAGTIGLATFGGVGAVACATSAPIIDGFISAAVEGISDSARRTDVADQATAAYFGSSVPAVHVWRLRRELDSLDG